MLPKYLLNNPFPDCKWSQDMKPVAILDGVAYAISSMDDPKLANISYFIGVNQKTFEKVMKLVTSKVMHFYEMRVPDISALSLNSKLEDISPFTKIHSLKSLVLEDTPKVYDLSPISMCKSIECLEYSGGIWKKNRTNSLEPISQLPKLKVLRLLNLSVELNGLKPLAILSNLVELGLSNQFPTDEYAYLSVYLEETKCDYFAPYIEISSPIDGKDVMVVGNRKPFLNKITDSKKITQYVEQFKAIQAKYRTNKVT